MQQRKQHAAMLRVDSCHVTASFADCKNAALLHHVNRFVSSFANNTVKNKLQHDIRAIHPSGGIIMMAEG